MIIHGCKCIDIMCKTVWLFTPKCRFAKFNFTLLEVLMNISTDLSKAVDQGLNPFENCINSTMSLNATYSERDNCRYRNNLVFTKPVLFLGILEIFSFNFPRYQKENANCCKERVSLHQVRRKLGIKHNLKGI